jgi:hypothetical protein
VLARFVQLLFILKILFTFFRKVYLNEKVNCTEPFLSVSIPWFVLGNPLQARPNVILLFMGVIYCFFSVCPKQAFPAKCE